MAYQRVVISSGHGKYIRGASGVLDEVDEARRVVERVADKLRDRGVWVDIFHDNTSHDQSTNLNTIVNHHNGETRDLDVSVHFNAYVETNNPMGVECLYVTQSALADQISAAIAACGLIDRGPKKRSDLFFLNNTEMPSILIETCFVDSTADADVYANEARRDLRRHRDRARRRRRGDPAAGRRATAGRRRPTAAAATAAGSRHHRDERQCRRDRQRRAGVR